MKYKKEANQLIQAGNKLVNDLSSVNSSIANKEQQINSLSSSKKSYESGDTIYSSNIEYKIKQQRSELDSLQNKASDLQKDLAKICSKLNSILKKVNVQIKKLKNAAKNYRNVRIGTSNSAKSDMQRAASKSKKEKKDYQDLAKQIKLSIKSFREAQKSSGTSSGLSSLEKMVSGTKAKSSSKLYIPFNSKYMAQENQDNTILDAYNLKPDPREKYQQYEMLSQKKYKTNYHPPMYDAEKEDTAFFATMSTNQKNYYHDNWRFSAKPIFKKYF